MRNFEEVALVEISRPKQWRTLSRRDLKDDGYPVYGANGLIGFSDEYTHQHPTIIIGCRGSCGSLHVTEPKSYVTGNAMALDELDTSRVDQRFLFHFLKKNQNICDKVKLRVVKVCKILNSGYDAPGKW